MISAENSLLEQGLIPVRSLATLSAREGWRPQQQYQAHRWFARRFSSVVRSLLVAARTSNETDFWVGYKNGVDYGGQTVLDPFVGGGTSVVEAQRLGASTIGVDVDAVACAITRFETRSHHVGDLEAALRRLQEQVGERLRRYYITRDAHDQQRRVLHFFWVQRVNCGGCGTVLDAHPHYQLAYEAEGHHQWVFCPDCYAIAKLPRSARRQVCSCGRKFQIHSGIVKRGVLICPSCNHRESLINFSRRTKAPPRWHLFALETLPFGHRRRAPLSDRLFQPATDADRAIFSAADRALQAHRRKTHGAFLPSRKIPLTGRSDDRLVGYGYRAYTQLFNSRQLLHLSLLAEAIGGAPGDVREGLALAFSDHLTTNCMMTQYAFGWRRLAPLFSIRAFRHVPRPVELNPWIDGTGRGTFPNAVNQVRRSVAARSESMNMGRDSGFSVASILQRDSRDLSVIKSSSVDLVLTDPPYFDNIVYSELSDFFVPWLQLFGLIGSKAAADRGLRLTIAARSRGEAAARNYSDALRACFSEISRVLKPDGRVVFTYQHRTGRAWQALLLAMAEVHLQVVQLFPLLGNSAAGPHVDNGSCQWDAVFVLRRPIGVLNCVEGCSSDELIAKVHSHWRKYAAGLVASRSVTFGRPDQISFYRACLVAAGAGMFCGKAPRTKMSALALLDMSDRIAPKALLKLLAKA